MTKKQVPRSAINQYFDIRYKSIVHDIEHTGPNTFKVKTKLGDHYIKYQYNRIFECDQYYQVLSEEQKEQLLEKSKTTKEPLNKKAVAVVLTILGITGILLALGIWANNGLKELACQVEASQLLREKYEINVDLEEIKMVDSKEISPDHYKGEKLNNFHLIESYLEIDYEVRVNGEIYKLKGEAREYIKDPDDDWTCLKVNVVN